MVRNGAVIDEDALNIYTDGSSYSGPRRGGIGILFVTVDANGDAVTEEFPRPGYTEGSSNEMELLAAVKALEEASSHPSLSSQHRIWVNSDSRYVVDNVNQAKWVWPKQRWMTRDGNPVAHVRLWKQLIKLIKQLAPVRVDFNWVKGHSRNVYNKQVDKLAKASAKGFRQRPLRVTEKRRKTTPKQVEAGSIAMRGQRLRLRIVTAEIASRTLHKYRCEVISRSSAYFGNMDWIYSEHFMKAGHHYEVTLNKELRRPRILRVLRELERD